MIINIDNKETAGVTLPSPQLTTYETQLSPFGGRWRSLLHLDRGNRYRLYTADGCFVQKNFNFFIFYHQ